MESKSAAGAELSDSWLALMEEKLAQYRKEESIRRKASIYRIPPGFGDTERDREAYTPRLVSLGPYHQGQSHLQSMERHKFRALKNILGRCNQQIQVYISAIREEEERARAFYEEITQSSDEFLQLMILDACFILEMFRVCQMGSKEIGYSRNDPVFSDCSIIATIRRDMMVVENQVPLFILDKLLSIQDGPDNNITGLILCFFQPMMCINSWGDKHQPNGGIHCLEVLWRSLMVSTKSASIISEPVQQMSIPCAIGLRDAGIRFQKQHTTVLTDVAFRNGILKVPPLVIGNWTESFFFNLIGYEKCADNKMYYANSYVVFMRNLIQSPKDVRYLGNCGILINLLRNDVQVVEMFERLGRKANVGANGSSLKKVSTDVNDHCNDKWNVWKMNFREGFKKECFAGISWGIVSVYLTIMLALTMVRTFYIVYGFYYKPR